MVLINTRPTCKDGASSDTLLLVVEDVGENLLEASQSPLWIFQIAGEY